MRNIKLHKTLILVGALAVGSAGATVDAFARGAAGGAGGGHAGHAAPSSGMASAHSGVTGSHAGVTGSHAGSLSPSATVGRGSPARPGAGTVSVRFGNTSVTE